MKLKRTSLAAGLLVLSFGCSPGFAQEVKAGMALVEQNCARCHAVSLTDSSAHKQAPSFKEVVKRYPPSSLAEALAEGITTGHPDMPEFVFSPDQIGELIAYLESLQ